MATMQLTTFLSAAEFLGAVRPALEADEAANNLMLGLALAIRRAPDRFERQPYLGAVQSAGQVLAAALMTPPHNVVVYAAGEEGLPALDLLAADLALNRWPVPGVLGPSRAALSFAESWQARTGRGFALNMHERVYELRRVTPPPAVPGEMRLAGEADFALLSRWLLAFNREAVPDEPVTLDEVERNVRNRLADISYFIWQDESPVAVAGKTRPTPHGCCVGPVYTPPEFRRRGYATALTAALSQRLLDEGFQFTALFTNLANPISNSIYQKIGYRPVCDFDLYLFGGSPTAARPGGDAGQA